MIKLSIKNPKPLIKIGRRGQYSEAEKTELMSIPRGENITLHLKAIAAKQNRTFSNVRNQYYKLQAIKNKIVKEEQEHQATKTIPTITVGKSKQNVSKFDSTKNAWTDFETELVMEALTNATSKLKAAKEVAELLENRSIAAIQTRYHYIKNKKSTEIVSKQDTPSLCIPEVTTNLFLEEVTVTMYKSLDGSLHEKAQDAVKTNVRTIIDSIPSSDVDDRSIHNWFYNNQDKVNYLLNTNPKELWNS